MRLSELAPQFLRIIEICKEYKNVSDMNEADGIMFACPKCFEKNSGLKGTHYIICWRPQVPQHEHLTGPGRWEFSGTGIEDLTLVAGSSSILLKDGCNAHFFIRSGEIAGC